jgi:Xaa-Pro aminopeptidase
MKKEGLDALVVFSDEYRSGHGTYLTGYRPLNVIEESPQVVILVGDEPPAVLIGRLNLYAAKDVVWIKDIRPFHMAADHLRELLRPISGKKATIGLIGDNLLPMTLFKKIKDAAPDAAFKSVTRILIEQRQIKSAAEVELMRRAAHVNDEVLAIMLKQIKVGMSEIQVAGICEAAARERNADIGSATVIMAGKNTNYPAWRADETKIRDGDFVLVDFNPSVGNYANDGGVTVLMPNGSDEQKRALRLGHKVLKDVAANIKPNTSALTVHRMMLERVEAEGFAPNFVPYTKGLRGVGHGVGVDVVEAPNLSSDSDFMLKAGMTLALKFDLHGLATGGLRAEVVVHLTENGTDPLNRLVLAEPDDMAILN